MKNYLDEYGPLHLRSGAGGDWNNGLCVMEAVAWLNGEKATDRPECACPVLGRFAIPINDGLNDENRQKLLPLALELTGSRSKEHEKIRAEYLVIQVANRIISKSFDKIDLPEHAKAFREAKTLDDIKRISPAARDAARAKRKDADAVADAYAYAVAVAYAVAYAVAVAVAYARQQALLECLEILKEAIALGPNGKEELNVLLPRIQDLGAFAKEKLLA